MNTQQNPSASGAKHPNDPGKNDPTKQDERDNDATRIRPSTEKKEEPETSPGGSKEPGNKGIEQPSNNKPPRREPKHKPEPLVEPGKQQGNTINKDDHLASTQDKSQNESVGKSEEPPRVKGFGRGL